VHTLATISGNGITRTNKKRVCFLWAKVKAPVRKVKSILARLLLIFFGRVEYKNILLFQKTIIKLIHDKNKDNWSKISINSSK